MDAAFPIRRLAATFRRELFVLVAIGFTQVGRAFQIAMIKGVQQRLFQGDANPQGLRLRAETQGGELQVQLRGQRQQEFPLVFQFIVSGRTDDSARQPRLRTPGM